MGWGVDVGAGTPAQLFNTFLSLFYHWLIFFIHFIYELQDNMLLIVTQLIKNNNVSLS